MQSRVSEYDQRILDITRELCLQLDISNYNPTFISWESLDSRSRREVEFRYDECLIEKYCVTLSARMKSVLEPDEWRPIIASSLTFSKKLRKRLLQGSVIGLIAFILLTVILAFELPILFPQPYTVTKGGSSQTGPLGYFAAGPLALVLVPLPTILVSVVYARKLRRTADKRAADIASATTFLETLNRIAETEHASGFKQTINVRGPIPLLPNIQARITRLQEYSERVGLSLR